MRDAASLLGQWIFDWQTLLSGLLALGAAIWAGSLLNRQIKQSELMAENERARKFLAARCMMPIHITEILNYVDGVARNLIPLQRRGRSTNQGVVDATDGLVFPSDSLAQMTRAIEFSRDTCFTKLAARIVSELQVLTSRTSELSGAERLRLANYPSSLEIYLIQAAQLHAMVSSLYRFCRQEDDFPPSTISWDDVKTAMNIWRADEARFSQAWAFIERQKAKGPMFECKP